MKALQWSLRSQQGIKRSKYYGECSDSPEAESLQLDAHRHTSSDLVSQPQWLILINKESGEICSTPATPVKLLSIFPMAQPSYPRLFPVNSTSGTSAKMNQTSLVNQNDCII
ncbi:hypothetical protein ACTXT7_013934 [Hymenolepis weldensis]